MTTKHTPTELLAELTGALDNAFISTWQSTAAWQRQLERANQYLAGERVRDAAPELLEPLDELLTDMVIAQGNMRDAAKHDQRWEGCAEAIQPRVDAARAAIAKATGSAS